MNKKMNEKICGIYCIENLVNGKKYIGQSIDIHNRHRMHDKCLKRGDGRHENDYLIKDFDIYGEDSFLFYTLIECIPEKDLMNILEIFYIKFYETRFPSGYNLTEGGSGVLGYTHSPERRKKISRNTPKRTGEDHHMFGKHWDKEFKDHLSRKLSRDGSPVFGRRVEGRASKYSGVCIYNQKQKKKSGKVYLNSYWTAQIRVDKFQYRLGYFKVEEEAAKMYDLFVIKNHLSNLLNFPEKYDEYIDILNNDNNVKTLNK